MARVEYQVRSERSAGDRTLYRPASSVDPTRRRRRVAFVMAPCFGFLLPLFAEAGGNVPEARPADEATANDPSAAAASVVTNAPSGREAKKPAKGRIPVDVCREITTPGRYSLDADLTLDPDTLPACLSIHDTEHVDVDCNGHVIRGSTNEVASAIFVNNVHRFSIHHCDLQVLSGPVLQVYNSSRGDLRHNTMGNLTDQQQFSVSFDSVHDTVVRNNVFFASFNQFYSTGNVLRSNQATCPVSTNDLICSALFTTSFGSRNRIDRNTIDGRGSANAPFVAAETGILLVDETRDVVSKNDIRNTWNSGIQTFGNIEDTLIASNSMENVGQTGVGGWYYTSWRNVTVRGNTVQDAGQLLLLFRNGGLRPENWDNRGAPADTAVYFQENKFLRNRFVSSSFPAERSAYVTVFQLLDYDGGVLTPGERPALESDFHLDGNRFTGNDFGHFTAAPYFGEPVTAGRVIDGGRNVCSDPQDPNYPLACR